MINSVIPTEPKRVEESLKACVTLHTLEGFLGSVQSLGLLHSARNDKLNGSF